MRGLFSFLFSFVIVSVSSVAFAAPTGPTPSDVAAAPAAAPKAPAWSLGAGLLGSGQSLGSVYFYGSTLGVRTTPSANVSLERRLSDRYNLTLGISGSVTSFDDDASAAAGATVVTQSAAAEVTGGLRYVLNPGGAVELSFFGAFSVGYETSTGENDASTIDTTFFGVGAVAGLVIERRLLDNLYLRLQTSILSITYGAGKAVTEDQGTSTKEKSGFLRGAVTLSPGLFLRMTF